MNVEQNELLRTSVAGLVRHGMTKLGGVLVAAGYLGDDGVTLMVGLGSSVVGVVWSFWQKRQSGAEKARLKRLSEVG